MPSKLPKINLYRNISVTFIVFTAMLIAAVFLFFSNKAAIIVTPEEQEINLSFNLTVKENPSIEELAEKDTVAGKLKLEKREGEDNFAVLSTKTASGELVGRVKIVNNYSKDQTLVKTTQLEAANGLIVRTNASLTVPAGGSVSVAVYPKEPEKFIDVLPGNLTIIKLAPSLQDKIYGVVEKKLTASPREVKVLAESDLNRAKEELSKKLVGEIKKELNLNPEQKIITAITDFTTNKKIGEETESFNLKINLEAKILMLDESQLASLISKKISNLNLVGLAVQQIQVKNLDYSIINNNLDGGVLVKLNYILRVSVNAESELLAKSRFAGKSIDEANQLLGQMAEIKDFKIIISPYWNKSLPKDENKIRVIVN